MRACLRLSIAITLLTVFGNALAAKPLETAGQAVPAATDVAQRPAVPLEKTAALPAVNPSGEPAVTPPLPARAPHACAPSIDALGPEMVVVDGGTFVLGSPAAEIGRDVDEGPPHRVTVQAFAIGRCEVTVAEFRRFIADRRAQGQAYQTSAERGDSDGCYALGADGSNAQRKDATWQAPGFKQDESEPVLCVSDRKSVV